MHFSSIKYFTFLLCINFYAYAQSSGWFPLNTNTNGNLSYMDFPGPETGYISTDIYRSVLKTTNAGLNFVQLQPPINAPIKMFNNGWGYIGGNGSVVYRTTNGGGMWPYGFWSGVMGQLTTFVTYLRGYVVGVNNDSISFWETTDGGIFFHFITAINDSEFQQLALYFINENTGFILGKSTLTPYGGKIYRTVDAGRAWDLVYTDQMTADDAASITFIGGNIFCVAGYGSGILKSKDGGISWTLIPVAGFTGPFSVLTFANGLNVFIKDGTGRILRSRDGGYNWNVEFYESEHINNVIFVNSLTGYAAGDHGKLLKTTDGGYPIGITPISGSIPAAYNLSQNYPNPFNPSTKFNFDILKAGNVKLVIYDNTGRVVFKLMDGLLQSGRYEISLTGKDFENFSSGIYFYQLITDGYRGSRKMILLK